MIWKFIRRYIRGPTSYEIISEMNSGLGTAPIGIIVWLVPYDLKEALVKGTRFLFPDQTKWPKDYWQINGSNPEDLPYMGWLPLDWW